MVYGVCVYGVWVYVEYVVCVMCMCVHVFAMCVWLCIWYTCGVCGVCGIWDVFMCSMGCGSGRMCDTGGTHAKTCV